MVLNNIDSDRNLAAVRPKHAMSGASSMCFGSVLCKNVQKPFSFSRVHFKWMGKKWRVKRGFVKLHMMVDTQTMKIVALSVTDESVGDVTKFRPLLGQSMDAVGARGGTGDAVHHPKDPGPDAPAGEQDRAPPRHPITKTVSRRASRPLHRSRTIRMIAVNRQRPISCTVMPRTAQGATWPRAPVLVWFRASCTESM